MWLNLNSTLYGTGDGMVYVCVYVGMGECTFWGVLSAGLFYRQYMYISNLIL